MTIEERLKIAVNQSINSEILWSQWSFDKALLTRSLNVISSIFPHYSLHESSHSNSIISEIEKILGSNIEKLSFIDAWLLLEASYWHDIGMIVTFEEKEKIINEPDFTNFLHQLSLEKNDLSEHANIFIEYTMGNTHSNFLELEKSFIFVLAEYIRREHPSRGKEILLDPATIGIKSPATGLINTRLFLILADIIECHGKTFENILELPFENDGLDVLDTAHPRFVACLLRIGDLLDLEDGRHCPTLIKTIGNLPPHSLAHLEKHRSIISKNVNKYYIEIIAKCKTFEAFEVQNDWFSFIQLEFGNQDKNWSEIVPKGILWKLPNLRKLTCELEGCVSVGNTSNRLTLDNNRIYEYLSSTNLYNDPLSCINELLQNSVDAIIDRIWSEHKHKIKTIEDFIKLAKSDSYKIDVIISSSEAVSDKNIKYNIEIKDNGKGMSIDDIQSLMTVASEKARIIKGKTRHEMPDWMRPSGFFGIGLQSVFAVADQLIIKTRHPNDLGYEIIIKKTLGKTPSFIVKKSEEINWNFGTSVIFSIESPKIPFTVSGSQLPSTRLRQFDPLCDETLSSTEAEIIETVEKFAQFCTVKIYFNNELCRSQAENNMVDLMIVDEENGLEYSLEFYLYGGISKWHYRGRYAESHMILSYAGIIGNIISGSADMFLTLDRKKFHRSGISKIDNAIKKSLIANKENILKKVRNNKEASLYYFLYDNIDNNDWESLELSGHLVSNLIKPGSCFYLALRFFEKGKIIEFDEKKPLITNDNWDASTLIKILAKLNRGMKIKSIDNKKYTTYYHPGESITTVYDIEIMDNKALSTISDEGIQYLSLQELLDRRTRYWLPCGKDQYQDISLRIERKDDYPWMDSLMDVACLFPRGIILRSTHKTLDEDIDTLISVIRREKELEGEKITEVSIRHSLQEFYKKFPFSAKKDAVTDLLSKGGS
jgi:hypothetical protein